MGDLEIDWAIVSDSFLKRELYGKSEIIKGHNKVYSMKSLYDIKDFDQKKQRFAKKTLISKKYEQSLDKNLIEWAKILMIDIKDL